MKIQKALADAGIASRRRAEELVAAGRVTVNDRAAQVGERVDPETDVISVDGRPLSRPMRRVYLVLNKPVGVTSTVMDRHADRTVIDLVPPDLRRAAGRLYPVGRLDRDSEGLLLLTNDGAWAERVLHPRYQVEREYAIGLPHPLRPEQARELEGGVPLEEGIGRLFRLRPATVAETRKLVSLLEYGDEQLHWYRAVLTQGWRRQIRRMFAAVDVPVARLARVRIGTLRLDALAPGQTRALNGREAARLAAPATGSIDGDRSGTRRSGPATRSDGASPASRAREGTPPAAGHGSGPGRRGLVVSLDGPSSSGKSTVGAGAALRLGYRFCDTGMLYRAVTWLALERGVDLDDEAALVALVPEVELTADAQGRMTRVVVARTDVTERVHVPEVDRHVSQVARQPALRAALLPVQRRLAEGGRIIMAGRDIGTVVLPEADLKLYLQVSLRERARRRAEERGGGANRAGLEQVEAELRQRDEVDRSRAAAPLRIPEGATVINSDGKTVEQTTEAVVAAIRERAAALGA
jgi:cytidylate kinase